jgi:hypothetical protein
MPRATDAASVGHTRKTVSCLFHQTQSGLFNFAQNVTMPQERITAAVDGITQSSPPPSEDVYRKCSLAPLTLNLARRLSRQPDAPAT